MSDLKPNDPQDWIITLYGSSAPERPAASALPFTGTMDEVLAAADEFESEVNFDVTQFVIRRADLEASDIVAELTGALLEARDRLVKGRPNLSDADSAAVSRADKILVRAKPKTGPRRLAP